MMTSFRKSASAAAALAAGCLLLAGCNLFNPTGGHKASDLNDSAKLIEAENLLRDKKDSKAAQLYREVIESDSTRSKAYFGLAKAQLRMHDVGADYVLEFVQTFDDANGKNPFLAATRHMRKVDPEKMAGIELAHGTLSKLARRDTLQARYLETGVPAEGYKDADYPLTDGVVRYARVELDMQLLGATQLFWEISRVTDGMDECVPFVDPACDLSQSRLFQAAVADTGLRDTANMVVDAIARHLDEIGNLSIDMLNASRDGVIGVDSTMADMGTSVIQATVDTMKTFASFYRLQNRLDDDGDGCADEEILDGKDNDGDGLVDEDLRTTLVDFFDNDRNGTADDSGEKLSDDTLRYHGEFLAAGKIGHEYRNLTVRNAVALDKDGSAYPLAKRRELIGSCWWNVESLGK